MDIGSTKIACIRSLIKKGQSKTEMIEYLISEQILTVDEAKHIEQDDFSTLFYLKMMRALDSGKIMLFDLSWTILPQESITITVVSSSGTKLFTYSEV